MRLHKEGLTNDEIALRLPGRSAGAIGVRVWMVKHGKA